MVREVDVAVELDVQVATGLGGAVGLRELGVNAGQASEERSGGEIDFRDGP